MARHLTGFTSAGAAQGTRAARIEGVRLSRLSSAIVIFLCASTATGKESSSKTFGKGNGLGWVGVGAGNANVGEPHEFVDAKNMVVGLIGGEAKLIGPIYGVITVGGTIGMGTIKYDYRGVDFVRYQAKDVDYTLTTSEATLGLKLRLIDAAVFHFYVEGGGMVATSQISYNTVPTTLATQGAKYQKDQKEIGNIGYYGETGIDIMFGKMGLRAAGRFSSNSTKNIDAIGYERMRYNYIYGYLALLYSL
jgi:hypothetical protein